jgi:hypothetical protein
MEMDAFVFRDGIVADADMDFPSGAYEVLINGMGC